MDKHYYRWIVNNWVHDVGTGMWVAALFVIWRLAYWRSVAAASAPGFLSPRLQAEVLTQVSHEMFWIMLASLLVIFVTGGLRLRYWRKENTADELPYKRRSLLVKHAVYLAVYGAGTVWGYVLQR